MTYFNVDIDQFAMVSRINISCRSNDALVITELYNMWWITYLKFFMNRIFDNRIRTFRNLKYFFDLSSASINKVDKNFLAILLDMRIDFIYGNFNSSFN